MANSEVSRLKFNNTTYDIADELARQNIGTARTEIATEAARLDAVDTGLASRITNLENSSGAVLVAKTKSAMSDTSKIYVYTGTATTASGVTYTPGHWYYHNGSKWTDGGAYTQNLDAIDATLTQSNKGADAKVTGDRLTAAESDISKLRGTIANEYTSQAYAIGDYCYYNGLLYRCNTAISVGETWTSSHWTAVDVMPELNNLKNELSAFSYVDDANFQFGSVKSLVSSSGWALNNNGFSESNASYKLVKYEVHEGTFVKIVSSHMFQFQIGTNVPASGTSPRIGNTYGVGTFYMTVPATATHLIVSAPIDDTSYAVLESDGSYGKVAFNFAGAVSDSLKNENSEIVTKFEIGTVEEDTGLNNSTNKRLRSDFIASPSDVISVNIDSNLQWFVLEYDANLNIIGKAPTWISENWYRLNGAFFRIILRKRNDSTMNVSDAEGFHVYSQHIGIDVLKIEPNVIATGYELYGNQDGLCRINAGFSLYKYNISACRKIGIVANGYWQFQNSDYVPAEGVNDGLIGSIKEYTSGELVDVPEGATWVILSAKNGYDSTGVYQKYVDESESKTNSTILPSPVFYTEKYIGHRGGGKTAPENTIPCLQQGLDNGFKIFEFDIQFTSDKVPVLLHDDTINRTGRTATGALIGGTINISDITYAEAQEYDFGIWRGDSYAGTKLPSLAEALIWLKKRGLCGELDCYGTANFNAEKAQILYNTVKECGMLGNCIFTGQKSRVELLTACGEGVCICMSTTGYTDAEAAEAAEIAKNAMFAVCSLMHPQVTADAVKYVHKYGMKAKVFTITSGEVVNVLLDYGADFAILDGIYPSEILLT